MMNKEKLIAIMEYKDKKIKEVISWINYFTEQDKQAIMNWAEEEAQEVVNEIKKDLFDLNTANYTEVSDGDICVFCVRYSNCRYCEYAKIHDNCDYQYSTYDIVETLLQDKLVDIGDKPIHDYTAIVRLLGINGLNKIKEILEGEDD